MNRKNAVWVVVCLSLLAAVLPASVAEASDCLYVSSVVSWTGCDAECMQYAYEVDWAYLNGVSAGDPLCVDAPLARVCGACEETVYVVESTVAARPPTPTSTLTASGGWGF
jgi:hypothetical protein